jgi:hypothetical protein
LSLVRGTLVLNTVEFIRETYGAPALPEVLRALPAKNAATFRSDLREASWEPLADLLAYMEAAKALLAPRDAEFFRAMGRFAGRRDREERAFGFMLGDLETATRMARTLWRSVFDQGSLEVVERSAHAAVLRVRDFPTTAALCQRVAGSLEGQLSSAALDIAVKERACVLDGAPYCEFGLTWAGKGGTPAPL